MGKLFPGEEECRLGENSQQKIEWGELFEGQSPHREEKSFTNGFG